MSRFLQRRKDSVSAGTSFISPHAISGLAMWDDPQPSFLGTSGARTFDGAGQYIELGSVIDPGTDDFFLSLWANPDAAAAYSLQQKIVADDAQADDYFGFSVAISGDTAIVGAYYEDAGGSNAGAVYIFTRSGSTWTQQQKIVADDAQADDYFGFSVAISGDTAIVGAYREDAGGADAGAAYVFTRSGSTWTQQQKLVASDAQASDFFGRSVSIYGDTAIVGAYREDAGVVDAGAAYVFIRSGSTWTQQQKLVASDAQTGDFFGVSVAISGDTAIVGAYYEDAGGADAGAAYVFTRSGTTWSQQQKLVASDAQAGDRFGISVAISSDTAIVGAYYEDAGGSNAGAAYVFTRSGTTWTQQQKLVADDAQADDYFGRSVSISGDTAIVGAYVEDAGGSNAGAAYVFTRSGTTWSQQQKLIADDAQAGDYFGRSVSISCDTAIVGAYVEDAGGTDAGAAYTYEIGTTLLRTGDFRLKLDDSLKPTVAIGSRFAVIDSALSVSTWTHLVITADRDDVASVYIDGTLFDTFDISTTQDALDTLTAMISHSEYDGSLSKIVYGTGLPTAAEVTELYNSGAGCVTGNLPTFATATVVASWNCNEASGDLIDSVGTNDGTDNGGAGAAAGPAGVGYSSSVSDGDPVTAWTSREGNAIICSQQTAAAKPIYRATGIGNRPALDFDGSDDYLSHAVGLWAGSTAGLIFLVVKPDVTTAGVPFASADEALNTKYLAVQTGDELSVLQNSAGVANDIGSDAATLTASAHIIAIASNGVAYSLEIDGNDETENVNAGANNGNWFGDTADRDIVTIGALLRTSLGSPFNGNIAEILVYIEPVSVANQAALTYRASKLYEVTLP